MTSLAAIRFEMLDPYGQGFVCLGQQHYKASLDALSAWRQLPTRLSGAGEMFACLIDSVGGIVDARPVTDSIVEASLMLSLDILIEDAMLLRIVAHSDRGGLAACQ